MDEPPKLRLISENSEQDLLKNEVVKLMKYFSGFAITSVIFVMISFYTLTGNVLASYEIGLGFIFGICSLAICNIAVMGYYTKVILSGLEDDLGEEG